MLSGGEAEFRSADAHRWVEVAVGILGSFY